MHRPHNHICKGDSRIAPTAEIRYNGNKMRKYLVIIEKGEEGYGAYSHDLPGCVTVGLIREETEQKMYDAISFHVEGLREERLPFPNTENYAEYLVLPDK